MTIIVDGNFNNAEAGGKVSSVSSNVKCKNEILTDDINQMLMNPDLDGKILDIKLNELSKRRKTVVCSVGNQLDSDAEQSNVAEGGNYAEAGLYSELVADVSSVGMSNNNINEKQSKEVVCSVGNQLDSDTEQNSLMALKREKRLTM